MPENSACDEAQLQAHPRALEFGFSYLSALTLPELIQTHQERLTREVSEWASAAVSMRDRVLAELGDL